MWGQGQGGPQVKDKVSLSEAQSTVLLGEGPPRGEGVGEASSSGGHTEISTFLAAFPTGHPILPAGTGTPRKWVHANSDLTGTKTTPPASLEGSPRTEPNCFRCWVHVRGFLPTHGIAETWVRRDLLGRPVPASCQLLGEFLGLHGVPLCVGSLSVWDSGEDEGLQMCLPPG